MTVLCDEIPTRATGFDEPAIAAMMPGAPGIGITAPGDGCIAFPDKAAEVLNAHEGLC